MEIICDVCDARIEEPTAITRREGDLEITFFLCPFCGKEYLVSVTDGELRGDVEEYARMRRLIAARKTRISENYIRRAEAIHRRNVIRSRVLIRKNKEGRKDGK